MTPYGLSSSRAGSQRLRLSLSNDDASRGAQVRDVVRQLSRLPLVRGALLVAPDGFVIDAALPPSVAIEPLAALAATLGRELEVHAARVGGTAFETAVFSADDGALLIGATSIGFVVLLGEQHANMTSLRSALGEAVVLLRGAWERADEAPAGDDSTDSLDP